MRIWHDNEGAGDTASWFLKYIIVRDLQTCSQYYFICDKWLAVEKGDDAEESQGLECELFVSCEPQKTSFKYLLKKQAKQYVLNTHIWLSIFRKPAHECFKRFDRCLCCFSFVYISMLLNLSYFYAIVNRKIISIPMFSSLNLRLNSLVEINLEQILIGLCIETLLFFPLVLLAWLFKLTTRITRNRRDSFIKRQLVNRETNMSNLNENRQRKCSCLIRIFLSALCMLCMIGSILCILYIGKNCINVFLKLFNAKWHSFVVSLHLYKQFCYKSKNSVGDRLEA